MGGGHTLLKSKEDDKGGHCENMKKHRFKEKPREGKRNPCQGGLF